MATASSNQGAREVYGAVTARMETPNGDSAMDDTNDAIRVTIVSGGGSGGTSATDDAAFTPAVGSGTPVMGFADETSPDSVDEGDVGVVRMTLARALHVNLRDASGAELAVGGGTQYDEDTVSTAADKITMAGVVRKDTAATLVNTDGDRTQMQVDATGRLYVNASGVAVPVTDNSGSLTVDNPQLSVVGSGTEATALRVTIATDSTGVLSVDDNGGNLSIDDGGNSITVDNTVLSVVGSGTEATAQRVTIATDSTGVLSVDDNGASLTIDNAALSVTGNGTASGALRVSLASDSTGTTAVSQATASSLNAQVVGSIAHDGADSGNPVKVGMKAIAHGANPTSVAAADRSDWYCNRAGIPFMIGGHPNIIRKEWTFADADNAQTNAALVTVSAGTIIVVTMASVMASGANTVDVAVRIGFATSTLSAAATTGITGIILSHPKLKAGSGAVEGNGSGIVAIGADNEDIRITSGDPVTGEIRVCISYYTIET